jgi:hypothetical protein
MRLGIALAVALAPAAAGELIDRVAVTVDRQAITESEIIEHVRAAAFLNGTAPEPTPEKKREAAERLVDLVLIRNEIAVSGYSRPPVEEAVVLFEQLRQERYKESGALERALQASGVDAAVIQRFLYEQLTLLRFIDFRFEAGILLSDTEVAKYYESKFVPRWKAGNGEKPVPELNEVREQVEAELADERGDLALEDWLKAARLGHRIVYREEVFQ